jgi:hypothetical protein
MNPPSEIFQTFLAKDRTEHLSQTERSHIVDIIAKAILNPGEIFIDLKEASTQ